VDMLELVMRLLRNRGVVSLQKQLKSTSYCKQSINNAECKENGSVPHSIRTRLCSTFTEKVNETRLCISFNAAGLSLSSAEGRT